MLHKFLFTTDLHYGFERRGGHKVALHDPKAWGAVLKFAADFKPDTWIMGGDMLDCGAISRHAHGKPGATEGMKLIADAEAGRKLFIEPAEALTKGKLIYITANHEKWLTDFTDLYPALEGLLDLRYLLALGSRWTLIPQGGAFHLGKLTFIHGDTVKGGEHVAKAAVINYERNVRFGHHHTLQVYSKNTALDYKNAKTGIAVPCLCTKTPKYGEGAPNRWCQGFLYGYIEDGGNFSDSVVVILDGKCIVGGVTYRG